MVDAGMRAYERQLKHELNNDEVRLFQENVIKATSQKWAKRWNNPVVVWIMRISVWGVWSMGFLFWAIPVFQSSYTNVYTHQTNLIPLIAIMVSAIAGPRMLIRELRHK